MQGIHRHRSKYGYIEYYKYYRSCIENGSIYDVDRKTYKKILDRGYEILFDELLKNKRIRFYPHLGDFEIVKYKPSRQHMSVNWSHWQMTGGKDGGELTYNTNQHSGGYKFFVRWQKPRTQLHNAVHYMFYVQKSFKRKLTAAIFDGLDAMVFKQHRRYGNKYPNFKKINERRKQRLNEVHIDK